MVGSALRRSFLSGALAVLALAFAAAGARASGITASSISSPGANSYLLFDREAASGTQVFSVSGTITGTGSIDINCYGGDSSFTIFPLAANVTVTGTTFVVPITTDEITAANISEPCVLRAVPTGDSTPYPPEYTAAFTGPAVTFSSDATSATVGNTAIYDFHDIIRGFTGGMTVTSAGDCGLDSGVLYLSGLLTPSRRSFVCVGALFATEPTEAGPAPQGEITVDGTQALDSRAASFGLPGYQGLTPSSSSTGASWTIHDNEPILLCTPNCPGATSYAPSGVELDRTWQTSADGALALQTDVFRSIDGRQHTISVLEDDDVGSVGSPSGAGIFFPGTAGFRDYALGATVALPGGPGTIEFKTDAVTPDGGDSTNPQGAIVYSSAPNAAPVTFTYSDEGSAYTPEFVLPYNRTIPPGGSVALRFGYVQAYDLTSVQLLAQTVLTSFTPSLSITGPASGANVTNSPITVTGTAGDVAGISTVTVNSRIATLSADGSYSVPVTLTPGTNALTAIATDNDGITTQKQVTVFYQALPTASTGPASDVTATTARIAGTVDPDGVPTTHDVQYGATTAYGSRTAAAAAGIGTVATAVSSVVTGLRPNTTYHYRVTATNASGTSDGSDRTFTTAKRPPTRLGARVTPSHATRFPYRYTLTGKLSLPTGITPGRGCAGRIIVTVRRGRKTIATAHATVSKKCRWKTALTLGQRRKVPGHGRLTFTPTFAGNQALGALTARPLIAGYG